MTNIAVIGIGNIGLPNAVLLARRHCVVAMDIRAERVVMVNERRCTTGEALLNEALAQPGLDLCATTVLADAVREAEFVIIAMPTDFDQETGSLHTQSMTSTIKATLEVNAQAHIVIRSTIPAGFVEKCRRMFQTDRIFFCPEFLREDVAYYDSVHPDRIVVGDTSEPAKNFARILADCSTDKDVPILATTPREAEMIKLFSNTYLAMRVAFFNELDSLAMIEGLDPARMIAGVGADARIGTHYNRPSMGYGGNCLPKDTQQLLADFKRVPHALMRAVVDANQTRIDFMVASILRLTPECVGIFPPNRAVPDKWRNSVELEIFRGLTNKECPVLIYDPSTPPPDIPNARIVGDLEVFKAEADLIVCDQFRHELQDVAAKVWTRDPQR